MDYDYDYHYRKRIRSKSPPSSKTLILQNNVFQMQLQRYEIFKAQEYENGKFDLTFEFEDGKKIHAHNFYVTSASATLDTMLSPRWSKDDGIVKIESYSSDNFFQFLTFLYSGGCELTKDNIFQITDMAEFYGIETLKEFCDSFLAKMEINMDNIFDMLELQERYSLKHFNASLQRFLDRDLKSVIDDIKFLTLKKGVIKFLSTFNRCRSYEEDFFKAIYKWSEGQALIKQTASEEHGFNMQETIKNEFSEILPQIKFSNMKFEFVKGFIGEKGYLFTISESIHALSLSIRRNACYHMNHEEEDFVKSVYELAEKQALETQKIFLNTDVNESIKMGLVEVIPRIDFSNMRFKFFDHFLSDKHFLFSPPQLYQALSLSRKSTKLETQMAFQQVYEMAEKEALEKQRSTSGEGFNLQSVIKKELAEVLECFRYSQMTFDFVLQFIVPKAFLFPSTELYQMLLNSATENNQEALFKAVYELAEKKVANKQLSSANAHFDFNDAMKKELGNHLHRIKFCRMKLDFIIDNILSKRFLFSPIEMYSHLMESQRTPEQEETFFKALYSAAETYALEKQEAKPVENFNVKVAIQSELERFIQHIKFSYMKLEFLADSVVENGFIFKADDLRKIFSNARKDYDNEEQFCQAVYHFAEKHALAKKLMLFNNNKNFDLIKSMKAEISSYVEYYRMSKTFLLNFVVKNGILSVDEVEQVFNYRIVAENGGKTLTGSFMDIFGIKNAIDPDGYVFQVLSSSNKQRFTRLKFEVPKTPSPLQKMKGVEWYLALEKCGTLTLQSYNNVTRSDYLIAEMRSRDGFDLPKGSYTMLKSYGKAD